MNRFGKSRLVQISIGTALVLGIAAIGVRLLAQAPTVPASGTSQTLSGSQTKATPPVEILYYHLFRIQTHLEEVAAQRDLLNNGQGQAVRTSLQRKIGLSDSDFAQLEASSQHLSGVVRGLDQQATAVAENLRTMRRSGTWTAAAAAPYMKQLKQLGQQRRSAIKDEITGLESRVSPDGKNLISSFLQNDIAAKTVTKTLTPDDIRAARAARRGASR